MTVDVVDDTGDAAVADRVTTDLGAAGVVVHALTQGTDDVPSAIQYPADREARAQSFADALDVASYLGVATIPRITIVLGPGDDATALLTALDTLTGCADPTPAG
jgi:hypothetical protein